MHFIARSTARALLCVATLATIVFLVACDDDDDPTRATPAPAIVFDEPDTFCSFDNSACDATIRVTFSVDDRFDIPDSNFVLGLDTDDDGTVDQQLDRASVLSGTHPDYTVETDLAIGTYVLYLEFTDDDTMVHESTLAFEVYDCRSPAPICINGLAIELMPLPDDTDADGDGDIDAAAMTIFASDFIASPATDCSGPIVYSINRQGEAASPDASELVLTCDDIGTVVVEIHGWDEAIGPTGERNHDWCETYVLVQDSGGFCAP